MRLIDADKIDFSEVFGGQSDFAKDIREAAQGLINKQPTAFNEEKVIAEMKKGEQEYVQVQHVWRTVGIVNTEFS